MSGQCRLEVRHRRQLVVEGTHDAGMLDALCSGLDLPDVDIQPIGGKTLIRENLDTLARNSKFMKMVSTSATSPVSLGVIRDADDDADDAFASVRDALIFAGFPAPEKPGDEVAGQLMVDGTPIGEVRVSVMILPGAGVGGCLESLCVAAMADDERASCVDQFFACLEALGEPPPENRARATLKRCVNGRKGWW